MPITMIAGALIIIATAGGAVVTNDSAPQKLLSSASKPSKRTVAVVGDRVVVAGSGYTTFRAKSAGGAVIAEYDFDALVAELQKIFPHGANPASLAEAARAQLSAILGHLGAAEPFRKLEPIALVFLGREGKQVEVWTVTARLDLPTRPPVVEKQRTFPGKLNPCFVAYGIERSLEQFTADWQKEAPPRLVRESPPFSIDEWAEIAGLIESTEKGTAAPVRQWFVNPSGKIEVRTWAPPK
jgi:hypothetical protein